MKPSIEKGMLGLGEIKDLELRKLVALAEYEGVEMALDPLCDRLQEVSPDDVRALLRRWAKGFGRPLSLRHGGALALERVIPDREQLATGNIDYEEMAREAMLSEMGRHVMAEMQPQRWVAMSAEWQVREPDFLHLRTLRLRVHVRPLPAEELGVPNTTSPPYAGRLTI